MTWQTGTADDHIDVLNAIRDVAVNRHVDSVAINNAGSGYVVGDILTVVGGAGPYTATLEVVAVGGGGDIASIRIKTGGAYTSDPTPLTANVVTGGTGTAATMDITVDDTGWTIVSESREVKTVAINAAGTNYTPGDTLTLTTGQGIGSSINVVAATFTVNTVDTGGEILTLSIAVDGGGVYEFDPPALMGVAVTGGTGAGATVDVTMGVLDDRDKQIVMSGAAGGASDDVHIGIRSFQALAGGGGNSANLSLLGFVNFNTAALIEDQVNVHPGLDTDGGNFGGINPDAGSYMPLVEAAGLQMSFAMSVTDRRIAIRVRVQEGLTVHYITGYAGFYNQAGTASEKPYPIAVIGTTPRFNTRFNEVGNSVISGVTDCTSTNSEEGPGYYLRTADLVWQEIKNSQQNEGSGSRSTSQVCTLYPTGTPNTPTSGNFAAWDPIVSGAEFDQSSIFPTDGSSPSNQLIPTPDSGGEKRVLWPVTIVLTDVPNDRFELAGELEGVFAFDFADAGNLGSPEGTSEDRFIQGTTAYEIVQNGSRVETYTFMALRED